MLKSRLNSAVFLVWIVQLSGLIGISLGYAQWFLPYTALNLLLMFSLLVLTFPVINFKAGLMVVTAIIAGFFAEYLGVNYGLLFGNYSYGSTLGVKLQGVPLIIGINWTLLLFTTAAISMAIHQSPLIRVLIGSVLMVLLDIIIEPLAPVLDFWEFSGGFAPMQNYIAWFVLALILHSIFQMAKLRGSFRYSLHFYLSQLIFFIGLSAIEIL